MSTKNGQLKLYHVHWCPECIMVREKLDALNVSYESVIVPDSRPQRSEVFEVSGQYYVPVLQDGEEVMSETPDIMSHLESKYGAKARRS